VYLRRMAECTYGRAVAPSTESNPHDGGAAVLKDGIAPCCTFINPSSVRLIGPFFIQ